MRDKLKTTWSPALGGAWPRRAVIGLWVAIFVAGGSALALRWDRLMAKLVRPPAAAATPQGGGAVPR